LGTDKPMDLGINTDPALFDSMLKDNGITLTDQVSNYCFTCNIIYSNPGHMDITVSNSELSSYIRATNNRFGPLKDIQIKLGNNGIAEMSANLDLKSFGYDFSGPVYAEGSIKKSGNNKIEISFSKGKAGLIPLTDNYLNQASDYLGNTINNQLANMPGVNIEELDINNGELHYKGEFPKTISASMPESSTK
jgi:hypothetical protein